MYIAYDVRNSVEYAKLVKSKRNGKRIEKKYTNSWSAYWASREYIASSKTVEDLLIERNDPREPLYNNNEFGTNTIGEPGNEEQAQSIEELNVPAWLDYGFENKQGSHN